MDTVEQTQSTINTDYFIGLGLALSSSGFIGMYWCLGINIVSLLLYLNLKVFKNVLK